MGLSRRNISGGNSSCEWECEWAVSWRLMSRFDMDFAMTCEIKAKAAGGTIAVKESVFDHTKPSYKTDRR